MSAVIISEDSRLSWRWRALGLLVIATFQGLLTWKLIAQLSTGSWAFAWLAAPVTVGLATAAYDILTTGRLTQKIPLWVFASLVSILAVHIFKLLHHSLTGDPFLTTFADALWVGICILWIRRHPLGTKAPK
jgi:hypothetical protein